MTAQRKRRWLDSKGDDPDALKKRLDPKLDQLLLGVIFLFVALVLLGLGKLFWPGFMMGSLLFLILAIALIAG